MCKVGRFEKPDLSDDSVERVDQHEVEERLRLRMQTDLHQLVRLVRVRLDAEARQVAVDHELHVRMTRVRTSRAQAGLAKQHVLKKRTIYAHTCTCTCTCTWSFKNTALALS